jgi:hypothetical protein
VAGKHWDCVVNAYDSLESLGIVKAISTYHACDFVLSFLLFISCILSFVNILSGLWIYGFCADLYAHSHPQEFVLWSSVAQTVDGNLRVRAPGFRSSAFPLLGVTPKAHGHKLHILYDSDGYLWYISHQNYTDFWYAVISFCYIW